MTGLLRRAIEAAVLDGRHGHQEIRRWREAGALSVEDADELHEMIDRGPVEPPRLRLHVEPGVTRDPGRGR
jgi:hypothetical protein